jgi:hypothetical protein
MLRPRDIGDVDQPVDALIESDKCPEIRQALHFAFDPRSDGILRFDHVPGVGSRLLHAERDLPVAAIDVEHGGFDLVSDGDQSRRMTHFMGP